MVGAPVGQPCNTARRADTHDCVFGHTLVAIGDGFKLDSGEHIPVRVVGDTVRFGCVRMSLFTWTRLVEAVHDKVSA